MKLHSAPAKARQRKAPLLGFFVCECFIRMGQCNENYSAPTGKKRWESFSKYTTTNTSVGIEPGSEQAFDH